MDDLIAAVRLGQILVTRAKSVVTGVLFFETQGYSSTLRYWLIKPEFRKSNLGSALMRRYVADHPDVKRFVLWVVADNVSVIEKYTHYGYSADGLIDNVLINGIFKS